MPFFIPENLSFFPHPFLADEDGFLAICNDLSPERLLLAYQFGIFPWYSEDDPVFWFYTYPRCVLRPEEVKQSKSMRSYFNQNKYQATIDTAFTRVLENCRDIPRKGQQGTWLTPMLMDSLIRLHHMGYAHSVEVWNGEELVGGLYGIALGKIFFGESMFSLKSNASKFGFIHLCRKLKEHNFELIDCQQETQHIKSLGGYTISKEDFFTLLKSNMLETTNNVKWDTWM